MTRLFFNISSILQLTPWILTMVVQFPENLVNDITNATSRADFLLNTSAPINYALPAWDGNANLGLSINKDYTLNVFYIGTDRKMYSLYSWYGAWDFASNQSESVWPLADESNAPFAIAYDQNDLTVRIYYFSNNTLMEIGYYDDSTWHDAAPVQTFNASAAVTSAPTGSPSNTPAAMSSSGLSSGAKAGVGVGVSLGVLGLISGAVAFFCFRRRRSATRRTDGMTPQQKDISPPTDSKSFDYVTVGSGVWKRDTYAPTVSAAVPTEMDATPRIIHEMPVKSYHELDG
jgi:hypothetical protein